MSNKSHGYDFSVKLLIIGDSAVGKSCLLLRLCENSFNPSLVTNIGIDFRMKTIEVDDKKVKLQIWDTVGQERYRTITTAYYKGAMGIILCYSVNDKKSFENIENWVKQIKEHASEGVCKILIGNKCDMPDRVISYEEGKRLADTLGMQFFETSAKEDVNVKDAFKCIAKEVKDNKIRVMPGGMENGATSEHNKGERLSVIPKTKTKKSGCC